MKAPHLHHRPTTLAWGLTVAIIAALGSGCASTATSAKPAHLRQLVLPPDMKFGDDNELACAYVADKRTLYCMTMDEVRVRQSQQLP